MKTMDRDYKFTHGLRRSERRRWPWLYSVNQDEWLLNGEPDYSSQANGRWRYSWKQSNLRSRIPNTDPRPAHDALVARIRAHRDELKALRKGAIVIGSPMP